MVSNHMANLEAMRISGKLVSAGPVGDPASKFMALAFFDVPKQKEIADGFSADQLVQRGFYSLRIVRMQVVAGILHPEPIETKSLVPLIMAVGRRIGTNKKGAFARHEGFLKADAVYGGLRFVCRGTPSDLEQEIQLYVDSDAKSVGALLSNDPLVQTGSWRYETYTVRLPKGTLAAMIE